MSATGADAMNEATSIAGLDLDDELQQLLKEQEDFLKTSKRPAAKVSRVGRNGPTKPTTAAATSTSDAADADGNETVDDDAASGPQILGSVVERDVIDLNIQNVNVMPRRIQSTGFPAMQRRGESLFGKRQRHHPGASGGSSSTKSSRFSSLQQQSQQQAPVAERDDPERSEIDRTNRARLQEMSSTEIRDAQRDLLASLDPALVAKLMAKKKKKKTPATAARIAVGQAIVTDVADAETTPATTPIDLATIQSEADLHAQAQLLPPDERAKHAWMQPAAATPSTAPSPSAKSNSSRLLQSKASALVATTERFDFDGVHIVATPLLTIPTHSGLFHHGDEPDAAGYTTAELVHLARSTVASQRAMALTTLGKILRRRQQQLAAHDVANVVPRVLQPSTLLVTLRIALDDQNFTALGAAISALHAFVVPIDAIHSSSVVDGRFGIVVSPPVVHLHPNVIEKRTANGSMLTLATSFTDEVVYIDTSASADDGNDDGNGDGRSSAGLSDEELAMLDPIQALLQMDVATRVRYILASIHLPDASASLKLLEILTVVANHSPLAAKAIATHATLLHVVERQFLASDAMWTQDDDVLKLQLTHQALVLVRALCQGSRTVASVLIAHGVVQSTKSVLALGGGSGSSGSNATLLDAIQCESLRLWRVLLSYGLDFHCFAYLFPILCGFRGAALTRPHGERIRDSNSNNQSETDTVDDAKQPPHRSASVRAALFAALEAFCGLASVHDAQHYFTQLGFFLAQARDVVLASIDGTIDDALLVAAALRFLAAAAALVTKFHLDRSVYAHVLQCVARRSSFWTFTSSERSVQQFAESEVLSALLAFNAAAVTHDLLPAGDSTEDAIVATKAIAARVHAPLLAALDRNARTLDNDDDAPTALQSLYWHLLPLQCDLLVRAAALVGSDPSDEAFVASLYGHGLVAIERLRSGHESWMSTLLRSLVFAPALLQRTRVFGTEQEATAMHRVLVPIYEALVLTDEEDATRAFGLDPLAKRSCQLRLPLPDTVAATGVGGRLLPPYWLVAPFSRIVLNARSTNTTLASERNAQTQEVALIVRATAQFLLALDASAAMTAIVHRSPLHSKNAAETLAHVLHVFVLTDSSSDRGATASITDVLADARVDAALGAVLVRCATSLLQRPLTPQMQAPSSLFTALATTLRTLQRLEQSSAISNVGDDAFGRLTSDADAALVLPFAETLVAEFTATSFGNRLFAASVTLLLASDWPAIVRLVVWRELTQCRLLHLLQPFGLESTTARTSDADDTIDLFAWTLARCAHDATTASATDAQLLQLMAQALGRCDVTATRGAFAYCVAVHHVVVYLFGTTTHSNGYNTMSTARQLLTQELVASAVTAPSVKTSTSLWRHLLSYDPQQDVRVSLHLLGVTGQSSSAAFGVAASADEEPQLVLRERVERVTRHAGLSVEDQVAFEHIVSSM